MKPQGFIKMFDEKIAQMLCAQGFSCVRESICVLGENGHRYETTLYSFAGGRKLDRAYQKIVKAEVAKGRHVQALVSRSLLNYEGGGL